jgi:hypothetical protein
MLMVHGVLCCQNSLMGFRFASLLPMLKSTVLLLITLKIYKSYFTMNNCCSTSLEISKWRRSAIHISDNIEGCERMLDSNEKLFRLLKSKYHVSHKQIALLIETSAFIGKEIAQYVDGIDKLLANYIMVIMDEDDGHHAVALIPTIKEIKEECIALLCRLAEHRQSIAAYERTVMRSKRVVFEKKRELVPS